MKSLLWLLLVASLAFNVVNNFIFSGTTHLLLSTGSGVLLFGSAAALWVLRTRQS